MPNRLSKNKNANRFPTTKIYYCPFSHKSPNSNAMPPLKLRQQLESPPLTTKKHINPPCCIIHPKSICLTQIQKP